MLNSNIVELLNKQINKEFFSSYLYLDVSNYYISQNLEGFGNWFKIQSQEEKDHALLFMSYVQNNDAQVALSAINAPSLNPKDFKSPLVTAQGHEQMITKSINEIYGQAADNKDYRTMQFLDWFIKEQGEEEKSINDLNSRFELFGSDMRNLYMMDSELLTRTYTPPTLIL